MLALPTCLKFIEVSGYRLAILVDSDDGDDMALAEEGEVLAVQDLLAGEVLVIRRIDDEWVLQFEDEYLDEEVLGG